MYPPVHAAIDPHRPAVVLAGSGATITYAQLDERSARLATWLRDAGLRVGDTVVVVLPNDLRWGEIAWACWRSGLLLTPVNRHLTSRELVPLMEDAAPGAVITTAELEAGVRAATGASSPRWLIVGTDYDEAIERTPRDPDLVETMGGRMLFSSGTTGRPKPFRVEPPGVHPADVPLRSGAMMRSLGFDDRPIVHLSTGPAYHAAPIGFLQSVHQLGGTVVLMERFDAERALAAIERHGVTHSQWVPTMFVRLLRLPEEVRRRYDLSTHRVAVHGAAPCPPAVKRAVIDWWGPIVHEYYGASEGFGRTAITSDEWLAHPGSVGRPAGGTIRITDAHGQDVPVGQVGAVWFVRDGASEPDGTRPRHPAGAARAISATSTPTATSTSPAGWVRRSSAAASTSTPARSRTCSRCTPPSPMSRCSACRTRSSASRSGPWSSRRRGPARTSRPS
jgi:long-chain acyl-CoA synthetase